MRKSAFLKTNFYQIVKCNDMYGERITFTETIVAY